MIDYQHQVLRLRPGARAELVKETRYVWRVYIYDGDRILTTKYVAGWHTKSDVSRAKRTAWKHAYERLSRTATEERISQ